MQTVEKVWTNPKYLQLKLIIVCVIFYNGQTIVYLLHCYLSSTSSLLLFINPPPCLMDFSAPVWLFTLLFTDNLSTFISWKSKLCLCSSFVATNYKREHHGSTPHNVFDLFCYLYHQCLRHFDKNIPPLISLDYEQSMYTFADCREHEEEK